MFYYIIESPSRGVLTGNSYEGRTEKFHFTWSKPRNHEDVWTLHFKLAQDLLPRVRKSRAPDAYITRVNTRIVHGRRVSTYTKLEEGSDA